MMDDLRDSRIMRERGVLGNLRESREGDESSLNTRDNDRRWRLVELEDGDLVVTTFCGECLEVNPNGEVVESECILDNDSQLWRMNGETLMNKVTEKCLNAEDERNFRTVECD